ncbi:MAG: hypothetical protein NVS3B20_19950 [Polyangiales bacterium]
MRAAEKVDDLRSLLLLLPWVFPVAFSGCSSAGESPTAQCPQDLPASCPALVPSYRADVAPIVSTHCSKCHSPAGQAPDRLFTDYAHLFPFRGSVLNQVYTCRMPPSSEAPLTIAERATLLGWLVCKAPDN